MAKWNLYINKISRIDIIEVDADRVRYSAVRYNYILSTVNLYNDVEMTKTVGWLFKREVKYTKEVLVGSYKWCDRFEEIK